MDLRRFFRSLRASSAAAARARVNAVHARVAALSVEQAEYEVLHIIRTADLFRVAHPSTDHVWSSVQLPSTLQSLFSAFDSIEVGGMRLRRADVAGFPRDASFLRIGSDLEHADVVVRRSDEHVFVIEQDGAPELDLTDEHRSVWHYLLELAHHIRAH